MTVIRPRVLTLLLCAMSLVGCAAVTIAPPGPDDRVPDPAGATSAIPPAVHPVDRPGAPATGTPAGVAAAGGPGQVAPAVPPAGGGSLPPGVPVPPAATSQLVTVLAPSASATSGTLRAWRRVPGGWHSELGPVPVKIGAAGVGQAREGLDRTPRGSFPLDQAFGRQPNPGTTLPYRRVSTSDWWVSDPTSPAYNTHRSCRPGSCPFDESAGENLYQAGPSYDYALVIGYNTAPVRRGAGSAFFVHVDAGVRSAGCVEVPRAQQIRLVRWLAPGQHPRITIGLG